MVRRFFRDSGIYGLAVILSKGATILLVPVYAAYLSPPEMGLLELLLGGIAILSMLIGLDLTNALALEYGTSKDPSVRQRLSSTALWFTVAAFGSAMLAGVLSASWIARKFLDNPGAAAAVRMGAVSMALSGIYLVVVQQLRWMMQPAKFGFVSVIFTLVSLGATILLAGPVGLGAAGVLGGTACGALAGTLLALVLSKGEFTRSFDFKALRTMVFFCLPLIPSSLAVVTTQYISRFAIEAEMGRKAVGVFGMGMRVSGLIGLAMLGFGGALAPLIYANHDDPATPGQLARIFRIFVVLAAVGLAGFTLFIPEILALLTNSKYAAIAPLLPWLAPAILLVQMYIFAPGPWIRRRTWSVAAVNVGTAVVAIILNWLLVPRMGLGGAALATLLSAAVNFAACIVISQRLYPVPHEWPTLAVIVAAGVAVMLVAPHLPSRISVFLVLGKAVFIAALFAVIVLAGGVERQWFRRAWSMVAVRFRRER